MRSRTAIRKSVKWGGAISVVLLVAVWAASGWWLYIGAVSASTAISVGLGRVEIYTLERPQPAVLTASSSGSSRLISITGPSFTWRFERYLGIYSGRRSTNTRIPIWFPTLLVLIPTALAWWLDRRATRLARIGLCSACGYDRRGLAAGSVCPECGAGAKAGVAS